MTRQQLVETIFDKGSYLCVGLDTDPEKLPNHLPKTVDGMLTFNKAIIDATVPFCVAYKINTAFYEAYGVEGWRAMEETLKYIPSTHFTIADAKRGDIGNTSDRYAQAFFQTLTFDAITVAPYMGEDSVRPFLAYGDKWTILLALTSNRGAADFELLNLATNGNPQPLFEKVVEVSQSWGTTQNLMYVVGATQPAHLERLRKLAPEHFFLVPGVGAQGGSLRHISEAALTTDCGLLVNVSRAIIYASEDEDYADEAAAIAQQYAIEMKGYLAGVKG